MTTVAKLSLTMSRRQSTVRNVQNTQVTLCVMLQAHILIDELQMVECLVCHFIPKVALFISAILTEALWRAKLF